MLNQYTQFKGSNPFGSQAKMMYHIDRLNDYVLHDDTYPIFVEFNLTDKCNLACKWCISENCRSKNEIYVGTAVRFLSEFKRLGGKAVTFSGGGEPTFHPNFSEIAQGALDIGLDVGLMTNGVYPDYLTSLIGNFKWVRFSIDTLDKEKYKKWKGKDRVEVVCNNALSLIDLPVKVGFNVNICMEHTIDDIEEIIKYRTLVDYIQFRPVLPRYFKDEQAAINTEVWNHLRTTYGNDPRVNLSLDKLEDVEQGICELFPCEGHFFNPIIQANGDVAVCMYHPNESNYVFGNLYENSFHQIWESARRREVIKWLREHPNRNCQMCCKLTELNKFLHFVNNPDPSSDVNFL